jgi:hypothetical protein
MNPDGCRWEISNAFLLYIGQYIMSSRAQLKFSHLYLSKQIRAWFFCEIRTWTAGAGGCWGAGGIIVARNSHASTFVLRCSLCCSLALLKFRCSGIQHQHSSCSTVLLLNCTIGWPACLLFLISCPMLLDMNWYVFGFGSTKSAFSYKG